MLLLGGGGETGDTKAACISQLVHLSMTSSDDIATRSCASFTHVCPQMLTRASHGRDTWWRNNGSDQRPSQILLDR